MVNWKRFPVFVVLTAGLLAGCDLKPEAKPAEKPKKDQAKKPAAAEAKPAAPKPPTHKVEKGPFKVEVTLKGMLEARNMKQVPLTHLEVWTPNLGGILMVEKAIAHGTPVHKGDPLLWLNTERLDQVISDLKEERKLTVLALKQAEDELPLLEKAAPVDLEAAERAKKQADEDMKYFTDVDKKAMVDAAHMRVKVQTFYLDSEKEELKQLEKMYRSKDLTEETEEIILKRQKKMVEFYTEFVKRAVTDRDHTLAVDLPRLEKVMQDRVTKANLTLEKTKTLMPTLLSQKRQALVKLKYDHAKVETRLKKLEKDLAGLIIRAPADGIVFHGKCVRGHWSGTASVGARLHKGAMLQADDVLFTIVQPRPLFVRAVVEEKDLGYLRADARAKVLAVATPDLKVPAKVESISMIPVGAGTFDCRVAIEAGKDPASWMPGMACTVKLVPYVNENALAVPATAVFTEDLDDDKSYVYLLTKDGKEEKRPVTLGKKADTKVEILTGLQDGDEILLQKPQPKPKGKEAAK